jgi:hypothetical protein
MRNKLYFLLICTILSFTLIAPVQAEEASDEGVARLVKIVPKAGHEDTLLKAIEDYHKWVANFDGHMEYTWYAVVTGPETGLYYARTGNHDWADFDADYDWQKEAGEVFERNVQPHIDKAEVSMTVEMSDVSHWPENWEGYNLFTVEQWYIMNGQYGKFNRGLKRIVNALKAGGFPYNFGFHRVATGGYANQITLVSPSKGWAGMSEEEPSFYDIMVEELGGQDEFEAFMSDWGSSFKTGRSQTVKYLPDASDYGND